MDGSIVDGVVAAVERLLDVVDEVVAVEPQRVLDVLHEVEDVGEGQALGLNDLFVGHR